MSGLPPLTPNAWLRYDVVARLLPPSAHTVLEIGCGQGALGTRIAATRDYLGLEPDASSCRVAQGRVEALGRGEVRNGFLDDVVEAGRTFDVVCAFEVIEHVQDDVAELASWTSRVRPGGWLMLSVPAFQRRYGAGDAMVGHYRRYEPDQMSELLQSGGLTDPQVVVYGAGLGQVLEWGRNLVGRRRLAKAGVELPAGTPDGQLGDDVMAELTSGSGRLLQPPAAAALAVEWGTAPFRALQRAFPTKGTGIVAIARKPA